MLHFFNPRHFLPQAVGFIFFNCALSFTFCAYGMWTTYPKNLFSGKLPSGKIYNVDETDYLELTVTVGNLKLTRKFEQREGNLIAAEEGTVSAGSQSWEIREQGGFGEVVIEHNNKPLQRSQASSEITGADINTAFEIFDFFPTIINMQTTEDIFNVVFKKLQYELNQATLLKSNIDSFIDNLINDMNNLKPTSVAANNYLIDLPEIDKWIDIIKNWLKDTDTQKLLIDLDGYKNKEWINSIAPDKNPGAGAEAQALFIEFMKKNDIKGSFIPNELTLLEDQWTKNDLKKNLATEIDTWKNSVQAAEETLNLKKIELEKDKGTLEETRKQDAIKLYGQDTKIDGLYLNDSNAEITEMFTLKDQWPTPLQLDNLLLYAARNKQAKPIIRVFIVIQKTGEKDSIPETYQIIRTSGKPTTTDTIYQTGYILRIRDNKVFYITTLDVSQPKPKTEIKLKLIKSEEYKPCTIVLDQGKIQFFDPRTNEMTTPIEIKTLVKAIDFFRNFDSTLRRINKNDLYIPIQDPSKQPETKLKEKLIELGKKLQSLKDNLSELSKKLKALKAQLH